MASHRLIAFSVLVFLLSSLSQIDAGEVETLENMETNPDTSEVHSLVDLKENSGIVVSPVYINGSSGTEAAPEIETIAETVIEMSDHVSEVVDSANEVSVPSEVSENTNISEVANAVANRLSIKNLTGTDTTVISKGTSSLGMVGAESETIEDVKVILRGTEDVKTLNLDSSTSETDGEITADVLSQDEDLKLGSEAPSKEMPGSLETEGEIHNLTGKVPVSTGEKTDVQPVALDAELKMPITDSLANSTSQSTSDNQSISKIESKEDGEDLKSSKVENALMPASTSGNNSVTTLNGEENLPEDLDTPSDSKTAIEIESVDASSSNTDLVLEKKAFNTSSSEAKATHLPSEASLGAKTFASFNSSTETIPSIADRKSDSGSIELGIEEKSTSSEDPVPATIEPEVIHKPEESEASKENEGELKTKDIDIEDTLDIPQNGPIEPNDIPVATDSMTANGPITQNENPQAAVDVEDATKSVVSKSKGKTANRSYEDTNMISKETTKDVENISKSKDSMSVELSEGKTAETTEIILDSSTRTTIPEGTKELGTIGYGTETERKDVSPKEVVIEYSAGDVKTSDSTTLKEPNEVLNATNKEHRDNAVDNNVISENTLSDSVKSATNVAAIDITSNLEATDSYENKPSAVVSDGETTKLTESVSSKNEDNNSLTEDIEVKVEPDIPLDNKLMPETEPTTEVEKIAESATGLEKSATADEALVSEVNKNVQSDPDVVAEKVPSDDTDEANSKPDIISRENEVIDRTTGLDVGKNPPSGNADAMKVEVDSRPDESKENEKELNENENKEESVIMVEAGPIGVETSHIPGSPPVRSIGDELGDGSEVVLGKSDSMVTSEANRISNSRETAKKWTPVRNAAKRSAKFKSMFAMVVFMALIVGVCAYFYYQSTTTFVEDVQMSPGELRMNERNFRSGSSRNVRGRSSRGGRRKNRGKDN